MKLRCRDLELDLDGTAVMGVLNVTPDSFSDGGRWLDPAAALAHAEEMVAQGADIIDVGGESTRPGAAPVPEDEELRRVIPVIEHLASRIDVPISIDTRKAAVARAAVETGASIINDTLGEETDHALDSLAAETGAAIVVMHSRGTPDTMRELTGYSDVVGDVAAFLARRGRELIGAGVDRASIALDPGFGFAKTPEQNLVMLQRLSEFGSLGFPLLIGTSRKSFIGAVLDLPTEQRLEGSIATVVWAIAAGAHIVRVHDVVATVRAARMADAIAGAKA